MGAGHAGYLSLIDNGFSRSVDLKNRNRLVLLTTITDDMAIASLANIGGNSLPVKGEQRPVRYLQDMIEIWAHCLMTNHVHLIVKPEKKSNLSKAIGEVHRRYTQIFNFRENWKGYLWQGGCASYPMDKS
jgi:hypothetical protein